MQIRVTKTFANFINHTAKRLNFKAHAELVTMDMDKYRVFVGEPVDAMFSGDYDSSIGVFKAIRVSYPFEYYACDRYLTTNELVHEFHRYGVVDCTDLMNMIKDMLEI